MTKQLGYLGILTLIITLSSCEFESYKDYEYPPYDGAFEWSLLTKNADWCNRYGHAAASFKDQIWVFGGYNPGKVKGDTYLEDVWSSEDGTSWTLVADSAPWHGRRGHRVTVFDDGTGEALFLVGGFTVNEATGYREYTNDVWRSYDGQEWTQIKPRTYPDREATDDWFPRFNHSLVTANHKGTSYLFIIGGASMLEDHPAGYAMKYFNDVWRSTDGITWERLPNNDFGIRSEAGAAVDPASGRIYIQGGVHGVIFEPDGSDSHPIEKWHWLWSSEDGINWTPEIDTLSFETGYLWRSDHCMIFLEDHLWTLSGKTNSNAHYHLTSKSHYAIWKREAQDDFEIDSDGCDIDPRHGYAAVIHNNKLFILGGFTSSYGQSNDVWTGEIQ